MLMQVRFVCLYRPQTRFTQQLQKCGRSQKVLGFRYRVVSDFSTEFKQGYLERSVMPRL
jgi:hypothetical protein